MRRGAVSALIVFNVGIFLLMAASTGRFAFTARQLYDWGGNLGAITLHGQPWRLLTAAFLHASPVHILGNMALLLTTGPYCQAKLGRVPALACYVLCALAASLVSAVLHPRVVSVGASGAIAGLLGIMVALYMAGRGREIRGGALLQIVGLNALYSFMPGVDWAAHAGGFVTGLAIGFAAAVSRTVRG